MVSDSEFNTGFAIFVGDFRISHIYPVFHIAKSTNKT